ncbi:hypothetical protein IV64_GL002296 [Lactiplantibacillus xiangfangensis]|uniref:Restriction endonuclease type IV Mrr domain-containing protein n=1 Tax=Lactiplantibacillus xiangfangensis TaxID=942150 RepID=A0A0R2MD92_9LACO|nr:hypothetical protein IV64_GL002296 [Lactiplantibacillus xiangfangensis]
MQKFLHLDEISAGDFPKAIAKLYDWLGYTTTIRDGFNDNYIDIIATKGQKNLAIQTKAYSLNFDKAHAVDKSVVNGLHSNLKDGQQGIIVTTGVFTSPAMEDAKRQSIKLYDRTAIYQLVVAANPNLAAEVLYRKSLDELNLSRCPKCHAGYLAKLYSSKKDKYYYQCLNCHEISYENQLD